MAIIYLNTMGGDYDTATLPGEVLSDNGSSVQTDSVLGNYVACNGFGFAMPTIPTELFIGFRGLANGGSNIGFFNLPTGSDVRFSWQSSGQMGIGTALSPPRSDILNRWHYYEIHVKTGTGTGILEIRVDGVLVYAISGETIITSLISQIGFYNIDVRDLIVMDPSGDAPLNNFIGEITVSVALPESDAGINQWTNSFGGSHFLQVNAAVPPGNVSFLTDDTPGDTELFGFPPLPGSAVVIFASALKMSAQKGAGSIRELAFVAGASGAVTSTGSSFPVAAGQYIDQYTQINPVNPVTGLAWTITDFNNTQWGFTTVS